MSTCVSYRFHSQRSKAEYADLLGRCVKWSLLEICFGPWAFVSLGFCLPFWGHFPGIPELPYRQGNMCYFVGRLHSERETRGRVRLLCICVSALHTFVELLSITKSSSVNIHVQNIIRLLPTYLRCLNLRWSRRLRKSKRFSYLKRSNYHTITQCFRFEIFDRSSNS